MITGSMVALITPFYEDGSVNYDKLRELVEWHIKEGTSGIVALGTTAETPALTVTEKDEIARVCIETGKGKIPIIIGSGSNNTLVAKEQSLKYEKMGADGLLVITPYYNKTNKSGMIHHFKEVADAVSVPVYIYNVPGRTGCAISFEALEELSKHPNIVGIKEASGDISFVSKISRLINENFSIYSGNDDMIIPLMSLGGAGVISVLANVIPKETQKLAQSYWDGDMKTAKEMQLKYLDFINALFIETNPIPVKEAMNQAGMNVGGYRLPLCEMEESTKQKLVDTMKALKLV
uniref:4-hydroxy-tetrahydrodipicolinate synthase n=1 Tax=Anaerovorax odorimutans TaxID=109327 RepID=UPI000421FC3F